MNQNSNLEKKIEKLKEFLDDTGDIKSLDGEFRVVCLNITEYQEKINGFEQFNKLKGNVSSLLEKENKLVDNLRNLHRNDSDNGYYEEFIEKKPNEGEYQLLIGLFSLRLEMYDHITKNLEIINKVKKGVEDSILNEDSQLVTGQLDFALTYVRSIIGYLNEYIRAANELVKQYPGQNEKIGLVKKLIENFQNEKIKNTNFP